MLLRAERCRAPWRSAVAHCAVVVGEAGDRPSIDQTRSDAGERDVSTPSGRVRAHPQSSHHERVSLTAAARHFRTAGRQAATKSTQPCTASLASMSCACPWTVPGHALRVPDVGGGDQGAQPPDRRADQNRLHAAVGRARRRAARVQDPRHQPRPARGSGLPRGERRFASVPGGFAIEQALGRQENSSGRAYTARAAPTAAPTAQA